jgi:hypothetical protein
MRTGRVYLRPYHATCSGEVEAAVPSIEPGLVRPNLCTVSQDTESPSA